MAPDDRDRMFDKALSSHLRSVTSSAAATNLSSDPGSPSSSCLDPETLAAYHERSLLPEQMNSAKEHIVACAHCQAILAQLELTESIPLGAIEKEEMHAASVTPAVLAQEQRPTIAAQAAPSKRAASPRPIRGSRWAWLVPAGALAAGLLVWVGLHENRLQHSPVASEVRVAKVEEPPSPLPTVNKQTLPALSSPKAEQLDELARSREANASIGGAVSKSLPVPQGSLKQPLAAASNARIGNAPASSAKESELRKDQNGARDSSVALTETLAQSDLDAKNPSAGVPQDKAALQSQAALQNQNSNILVQNQALSQKVAGPSPLTQAEPAKKAKTPTAASRYSAAPSAPAPPPPPEAAAFAGNLPMEERAIPNQHLIAVPGSSVRWLAGGAGLIEFSSDKGASWTVQSSGVTVDLLTGSAPSDKICWMVGRVGAILLTTDGGAHWSVIHSPLNEDLAGVRASDALHATIWNLLNTKSFETFDGGTTWKPVANQ